MQRMEREDYRSGLIEARVRNLGGVKNTHPFDSFPHWKQKAKNRSEGFQNNMKNTFSALKKLAKKKQ